MLDIKAVLDQKNSYALFLDSGMCKADIAGTLHLAVCLFPGSLWQFHGQGWFYYWL